MESNDISKGGSFYLQSKVVRAKELLDEFQKDMRDKEQDGASGESNGDGADADTGADKKKKSSE
jgi:import inner membrane translocase subunit TIM16